MLFKNILKIVLCLVLLIRGTPCISQNLVAESKATALVSSLSIREEPDLEERPKNYIFLNFCGDGSIASLNYERLFFIHPKHFFIAAGAGAGMNFYVKIHNNNESTTYTTDQYVIVPHHITFNIGSGRHFFELGAGGAILAGPRTQPYLPYVTGGYRIQPWNSNKVGLRLFFSYPLETIDKFEILYIPVGLSVGWAF